MKISATGTFLGCFVTGTSFFLKVSHQNYPCVLKSTLLSSCFFYILVWTWFFDHYESGPQLVAWVGTNISFCWSAGKLTIITANLCSKTWSPFCHSKINMDFYFIDFILFFHLNQFFIAFFSIGMGAVPWLIMSEVTFYIFKVNLYVCLTN